MAGVSPEGTAAVRRVAAALRNQRGALTASVLLSAIAPLPVRVLAVPLRLASRLLPHTTTRLTRALSSAAAAAEALFAIAHAVAALELCRQSLAAVQRLRIQSVKELMCADGDDPHAPNKLTGDPLATSRTVVVLCLAFSLLFYDRLHTRKACRVSAAIDACILLFLVSEGSPLAFPFGLHVCVDTSLRRIPSELLGTRCILIANTRAAGGSMLCFLLIHLSTRRFHCREDALDSALVIVGRLFTLARDLTDCAFRARAQSMQVVKKAT